MSAFKLFTVTEALSKAFRENTDKQSGQISVTIVDQNGDPVISLGGLVLQEENRLGSECTGSEGATGRVLTLQNTDLSKVPFTIWVDGQLIAVADYTVNNLATSSTITFDNVNIFNAQTIRVRYYI